MRVLILLLLCMGSCRALASTSGCPDIQAMPEVIPAYESPFSDGRSVISEANRAQAEITLGPLRKANSSLIKVAEDAMVQQDEGKARCALAILQAWAESRAGTRMETDPRFSKGARQQSLFEVKWMLIGKAFAYQYVKPQATPEQRRLIEAWLTGTADYLADIVLVERGEFKTPQNNHLYWVGAALMSVGVATGNEKYVRQARRIYEQGISEIPDAGYLPQEMARKTMALHYAGYAAAPLVLMAEMSHQIGEDWYTYRDERIRRLLRATIEGFADPAAFGSMAGYPQDMSFSKTTGTGGDQIWMPFAYARYGADFAPALGIKPSYSYSYCGNVQQLIDAQFFAQRVELVHKAHWWD